MTMDQYMKFKMWDDMKIFPNATYDKINLSFGEGEIITFRGESMDYYRSEALIGDKDDDRQFLSILYRHIGRYHSFDELNIIMDSVKKRE
jgi:hypothetical protein